MRSLSVLVLAAFVASLLVVPARAADASATILGSVRTAAGIPVGDARIALTSPTARYAARSDARGRFTVAAVDPDVYTAEVAKSGFAAWRLAGVIVNPGATVRLTVTLAPQLQTIGSTAATIARPFNAGSTQDTFTVSGAEARGALGEASSGLAEYTRGTVQSAVARVPGVQQDAFANVVIRGGKVDDTVFGYDGVPVPQAIIAEPGGNVIGAQLPTTGLGFTRVTTGGFSTGADDALGGIVDEIPQIGVYPPRTILTTGVGLLAPGRNLELDRLWATPSLRQRYAFDAQVGSQAIRYGDGSTFYPAEAATYGLALAARATWSVAANAHLRSGTRDDVEVLALAGEATYDQYGTPFAGQTYGAFDGAQTVFPGEPSPDAPVRTPTRIRGTYAIEKIEDLRTYDQSYARVRLYRSQYGSQTSAPFFDDLSFPNGVISYAGQQSGVLTGFGFDAKTFAAERHRTAYGFELRRQTSSLDQVVPTFDERLTSNPVLSSVLGYLSDELTLSPSFALQGALRANATHVSRSDGARYGLAALDPHVAAVYRFGGNALRLTFDHTTVAPKPLETERHDSTETDAPFVPLAPERGDSYELSFERQVRGGALRVTVFAKTEKDRIDVLPADFRSVSGSTESPGSGVGVPQNVGALLADGVEVAFARGPLSIVATSVHARSSSASQFALNDLNAPAIAVNHLFPVGYVPDLSAIATYRLRMGKLTIAPSLSYETGYPYGNGRKVWLSQNGFPQHVLNDNHVNPGYNYYFLRDPSQAYDPMTNPIVGTLGTAEGDDPNTLRSTPLLLASLHVEHPLSSRTSLALDVANLFGTATPTQLQSNPYLIGPPGYAGGNAAYAAWYGQKLGGKPYALGNGVPTNDGATPIVPWQYGTGGYVPASFPEARSVSLSLRVTF